MSIAQRIQALRQTLPTGVSLLAISKYQPIERLQEAYDAGQRMFGENHIQEMAAKAATLPADIQWHFTGHVQTNKIKYMASFVSLIHGVDSYKLLAEINKQAAKAGRVIPCLLQIHIAQEETKFGFTPDECMSMLDEGAWRSLTHVQIAGVMGMATNTDDPAQVEAEFASLSALFRRMKETHFSDAPSFKEVSMGMSDDYPLAIRQGSTLIRIGSRIFGARNY